MAGRGKGKGGWGQKSEIQKLVERQDSDGTGLAQLRQMGKEAPPLYPPMEIPQFVERNWEEIQQELVQTSFRLEEAYRTWPYRISFESATGESADKIERYSDRFKHTEQKCREAIHTDPLLVPKELLQKKVKRIRTSSARADLEVDVLAKLDQIGKAEQQEIRAESLGKQASDGVDGEKKKEAEGSDAEAADDDDEDSVGDNDGDYAGNYFDNGEDGDDDGADDDDEPVFG